MAATAEIVVRRLRLVHGFQGRGPAPFDFVAAIRLARTRTGVVARIGVAEARP
jgi:hypothetical protein